MGKKRKKRGPNKLPENLIAQACDRCIHGKKEIGYICKACITQLGRSRFEPDGNPLQGGKK